MEMCAGFSRLPRPSYSSYEVCFKSIDSFRVAVTRAMISQMNLVLDREEFGVDAKTAQGKKEDSVELWNDPDRRKRDMMVYDSPDFRVVLENRRNG